MLPIATIAASLIAGIGAGGLVLAVLARGLARQAARDRDSLLEAAGSQIGASRRAAQTAVEERRLELEAQSRAVIRREHEALGDYQRDLDEREALIESREEQLRRVENRITHHEGRQAELERQRSHVAQEAERIASGLRLRLERRGEWTHDKAIKRTTHTEVSKWELAAQMRARREEERAQQNSAHYARTVMAAAVDRYRGVGHLERIQNAIPIPDPVTREALGTPESSSSLAFVESVGCDLVLDSASASVIVRGEDPLAREVARRTLRQLANRSLSSPDKVRALAAHVRDEVDREVNNAAKKAVRLFSLDDLHPEIRQLVGRLKFRLSYSQNQWKHAIEVAYLAGILASELGLDPAPARRGGLLHDIGKAMTHDHDGAHAVLGAEVARRCGEEEIVANAIGSHHKDEPPESPIAEIVTAADALSGARPGARRENAAAYMTRIADIQRISQSFPAVERVEIMHAGREVRVVVASDERGGTADPTHGPGAQIRDADLHPLARDIARTLEEELTYAGQIRVTVIRETRSISVAH